MGAQRDEPLAGVQVRRLQPREWPALRAVRLAALADAPEAFASTLAYEQAFDDEEWRRRAATSPAFVAWRAGEPVGLVVALNRQEGRGGRSGAEWQLVSMWVSPGARGNGSADLLVAAAVDFVRAESAARLALWVADGNARARAFYERTGFRPTSIRQTLTRHDGSTFGEEKLVLSLGATG